MAIARGRNNIQASIEDEAYLLICAATEINQYYKNKCIEILSRIEEIKKENMTENPEVIHLEGESRKMLILDEEGKFKQNPRFNLKASRIAYRFHKIRETDVIVGTAMLCDENLF